MTALAVTSDGSRTALQRLHDALTDAGSAPRRTGTRLYARCPAHEDRSPSLSADVNGDGNGAVLTCHAGCATSDVLAALGLGLADLYDEPLAKGAQAAPRPVLRPARPTAGTRRRVAQYRYCDDDGELLYTVERWEPGRDGRRKDFVQRPASGHCGPGAMEGVPRVLYRLPEVRAAVRAGLQVYVVEGEKDADRLAELGHAATCNSGGADPGTGRKWLPEHTQALRGAFVTVVADDDQAGRRHARYIAEQLAPVAASVDVMRPAVGKDVSEHLDAGEPLGELLPLGEEDPPPEPAELPAAAVRGWGRVDLTPYLDGTYAPPVPELLRREDDVPLLYPGRTHWLSAEPEAAKTWLALLACAQVLKAGGRVLYIDLEDGPDGITARLLALGVTATALAERFDYRRPAGPLDGAIREHLAGDVTATVLVVVDACTEAMSLQGLAGRDDGDVATWLELLPRWAARLGPAVLVIDHVVKDAESRGRWATGSQHKLAGLDGAAYALTAVQPFGRGMTGRSRLTVEKDRSGQIRPHAVRMTGGRDWIADLVLQSGEDGTVTAWLYPPEVASGPFRPTVLMQRVSDALAGAAEPLSGREIEDRVCGKAAAVRQALAALVDEGYVRVETGHHNSKQHHLVRAFDGEEEGP